MENNDRNYSNEWTALGKIYSSCHHVSLVSILTCSIPHTLILNKTVSCETFSDSDSALEQIGQRIKRHLKNKTKKTYLWLLRYDIGETCTCFMFVFTMLVDELSTPTWVTVRLWWVIAAVLDNEALRDAITVPSRLIYKRLITPAGALLTRDGFLETITERDVMGRYTPQEK